MAEQQFHYSFGQLFWGNSPIFKKEIDTIVSCHHQRHGNCNVIGGMGLCVRARKIYASTLSIVALLDLKFDERVAVFIDPNTFVPTPKHKILPMLQLALEITDGRFKLRSELPKESWPRLRLDFAAVILQITLKKLFRPTRIDVLGELSDRVFVHRFADSQTPFKAYPATYQNWVAKHSFCLFPD